MDIETGFKGAYHIFIARNSRKQAKFYLRIVGVYEQIIVGIFWRFGSVEESRPVAVSA